jgi:hypothetical protein
VGWIWLWYIERTFVDVTTSTKDMAPFQQI